MYKAISIKSLNITIQLGHDFTEEQCCRLMGEIHPGVTDYQLHDSYIENNTSNWLD